MTNHTDNLKAAFTEHDIPWPYEFEFNCLVDQLDAWRNADHADALTLSRHQVILLLTGIHRAVDERAADRID